MGKHVLLLNSADVHEDAPNSKWSVLGPALQLENCKHLGGTRQQPEEVYRVDCDSTLTLEPKLEDPVAASEGLFLTQSKLLLQLFLRDRRSFRLEVTVTDKGETRHKITFLGREGYKPERYTVQAEDNNVIVPVAHNLVEGKWMNF